MNALLVNPFQFSSAPNNAEEAAAAWHMPPAPEAAAVTNSESAASLPARLDAPTAAGSPATPEPAAFSVSDTQYIPELFSVYAARRCKDLISPPRNIDGLALRAVEAALNLHPRDLDNDPPPLFLRKPRPAFLRALFELGGTS